MALRLSALLAFFIALAIPLGVSAEGEMSEELVLDIARDFAWTSQIPCSELESGCFLDTEGHWANAAEAHHRLLLEREPHYIRAAGEMLMGLGIGAAWYWLDRERNQVDWDKPSARDRFNGEAVRYDTNTFSVNFAWHAMSGSAFYGLSRGNGLNVGYSYLYAMVTSTLWEYVLEYNEKISRNDLLLTPTAGLTIGEFWHRLGRYLTSPVGGFSRRQRALAWGLSLPQMSHDAIDGLKPPPRGVPADEHGYNADLWHGFRTWLLVEPVFVESRATDGAISEDDWLVYELGFEGEFVAVPGFLRPGRFDRLFFDAEFTALRLQFGFSAEGTAAEFRSDTVVAGYYTQTMRREGGVTSGLAHMIGLDVAYLYRRESYDAWNEQLAVLHLPGLAYDLHARSRRALFRLGLRVNGDFAGVNSLAFSGWEAANPMETSKAVLHRENYYYGWGWSWRARAELTLPYVKIGGRVEWGRYSSADGNDRQQESITVDTRGVDVAWDYEAWVRVQPLLRLERGLYLEASARGQRRESTLEGLRATARLDRVQLGVGTFF